MQYSQSLTHILLGALAALAVSESLADDACLALTSRARDGRHYTVDAILPICEEELKHSQCEFIAESLSLAMSHPGFNGTGFCAQMDAAQFCSNTMDELLTSQPVEDLAYGQCLRAHKKDDTYCRRFQTMFREAVEAKDLNTLRACFKIEAEHDPQSGATEERPVARIIASGSQDLTGMGNGTEAVRPTESGKEEAEAVPPKRPVEVEEAAQNRSAEAVKPAPGDVENIIVEPIPASEAATDVKHASRTTRGTIIVDPVPAPKKQAHMPNGTIIVEPVPLGNSSEQSSASSGWDTASILGEKEDVAPPPQVRPAAPGRGGVVVEPAPMAMTAGENKTKVERAPIIVEPVPLGPATLYVIPASTQAPASNSGAAVGTAAKASGDSTTNIATPASISNATIDVPASPDSSDGNAVGFAVRTPASSVVATASTASASNATVAAQAPLSSRSVVTPVAMWPANNTAHFAALAPAQYPEAAAAPKATDAAGLAVQQPLSNRAVVVPVSTAQAGNQVPVSTPSIVAGASITPVSSTAAVAAQAPVSSTAVIVPVVSTAPARNTAVEAPVKGAMAPNAPAVSNAAVVVLPAGSKAEVGSIAVPGQGPVSNVAVVVPAATAPVDNAAGLAAQMPVSNAGSTIVTAVTQGHGSGQAPVAVVTPAARGPVSSAAAEVVNASKVSAAFALPAAVAAKASPPATNGGGALIIPLLRAPLPHKAQQVEVHGAGLAEARAKVARKSASGKQSIEKAEYNGFLAKFVQ